MAGSELTARPFPELLFPELAQFGQPLAAECVVRRTVIATLSLLVDYRVDETPLIDTFSRCSVRSMAEVDLEHRVHRNRQLHVHVPQAASVIRTILSRAGVNVAWWAVSTSDV